MLLQFLQNQTTLGFKLTFGSQGFNTILRMSKIIKDKTYWTETWLPDDHITDIKVIDCFKFMANKIDNEAKNSIRI